MLGLEFFKTLVKNHGLKFFEPIGKALQRAQIRNFNPMNPAHAWALRTEMAAYGKWALAQKLNGKEKPELPPLDPRLADHVSFAVNLFRRFLLQISGTMR